MIQPKTQTKAYWVSSFTLSPKDVEHVYNLFLETESPQRIEAITRAIMAYRVAEERNEVKRRLAGRIVYQPRKAYAVDDELVFPALQFANGTVTSLRTGTNPTYGEFSVVEVEIDGKKREFAAELDVEHPLNMDDGLLLEPTTEVDLDALFQLYGSSVTEKVVAELHSNDEFVGLGEEWFIRSLMTDINIGHLHLAEAVLEMNEGGPLTTADVLVHLDMSGGASESVKAFSLNYALLQDERFDEVGSRDRVVWFLKRLEPPEVQEVPERLRYTPIPHDRALLNPQLLLLERELDDEWSDLESIMVPQPVIFPLNYAHRASGTLPLSSRLRTLFDLGKAARQRIMLVDEHTGENFVAWVVQEQRYIVGLTDWYQENDIPVGGFISLKQGPEPAVLIINFDRRRPQREWVRLASAENNRIKFELQRRSIGCVYDDQLIVGTDYVAAMDALFRRAESRQRSIPSLLAEIFPELSALSPQNSVHAKTLYSAINILRRVPPGPLFAELVRHPAFQPLGDHYWQFVSSRWQRE